MLTRRQILQRGIAAAGGLTLAQVVSACGGEAEPRQAIDKPGYGPLTAAAGPALLLPAGFRYVSFGAAGSKMADGLPTPPDPGGTGHFPGSEGVVVVMRNQVGSKLGEALTSDNPYDPLAEGGVTLWRYDLRRERLLGSRLVLNGVDGNRFGGVTPWGSWLSCEATTAGRRQGFKAEHGYVFEVPTDAEGPIDPVPLKDLGRFAHGAAAVDPESSTVYMTEVDGDPGAGFYRFLPEHDGELHRGGELEMLAIADQPYYDADDGQQVGKALRCEWVRIDHPDPPNADRRPDAVHQQGYGEGGARFSGLGDACFDAGSVYFTAGGERARTQVWQYTPDAEDLKTGELTLLYESARDLAHTDGIAISPRGGIALGDAGDGARAWIRGLSPRDDVFDFAADRGEAKQGRPKGGFTGIGYSPDGRWLFANVRGATHVITGPWEKGWL